MTLKLAKGRETSESQRAKLYLRTCVPNKDADHPVNPRSDQSSMGTLWIPKDPKFFQADSDDHDQTTQMRSLI